VFWVLTLYVSSVYYFCGVGEKSVKVPDVIFEENEETRRDVYTVMYLVICAS
jgi:hypothetical protein